ncbi:uncharacterized protein [Magallana gigas]|uniref:uncharacterized protein n=1 Tax=Magallana gigas TaxID=29159 RepID=UPI0033427D22
MSKLVGLVQLVYILWGFGGVCGLDRTSWFGKVILNSSQLLSLKDDLQLETDCPSVDHCATQCLLHRTCETFLSNESPEICQLFGRRVDILSEDATGMYPVFTKQNTCEDIGYISVKTKHTCLKKFHTPQFWVDANNTCVNDGGHLFTIKTLDVLNEVLSLTSAIDPTFTYFHIDGNDLSSEGNWVFHDGSSFPLSSPLWGNTEPEGRVHQNCLIIYEGTIHDSQCDTPPAILKFICEKNP